MICIKTYNSGYLEMVEHLGSGLDRIVKAYGKESFKISSNFMKNIFYKYSNELVEGINSLYLYIKENPNQRVSQIKEHLHIPAKTLERWIKQLKEEEKIIYKGSKKTGGYFVL